VVINGTMLADISGEEVETYMLQNGLVGTATQSTDVPLNAPCSDAEHAAMVNVRI
jgi:monothiol glutaredoxin